MMEMKRKVINKSMEISDKYKVIRLGFKGNGFPKSNYEYLGPPNSLNLQLSLNSQKLISFFGFKIKNKKG